MMERIAAALGMALLEWAATRLERGAIADEAKTDVASMRAAGARVREWMRQQGRAGDGGSSGTGRP